MSYPLVRDLADEGIAVSVTCGVLGFSTQAFYKWQTRPCSDRDYHDACLINAMIDIHADDPAFGYRFIYDELTIAGWAASENRVQRLAHQEGIWSIFAKKRGLSRRAGPPVHDDHLRREFTATSPDERWVGDIERHGALFDWAVLKGHRRVLVAAGA